MKIFFPVVSFFFSSPLSGRTRFLLEKKMNFSLSSVSNHSRISLVPCSEHHSLSGNFIARHLRDVSRSRLAQSLLSLRLAQAKLRLLRLRLLLRRIARCATPTANGMMLHDTRCRVHLQSVLIRRHAWRSFFTGWHFGERQQRIREIRWSGWRIAWCYLAEVGAGSLRAGRYRRLLEKNTESGLELPMCRLQQLLGLFPGAARGQHELIDHHLLPKGVHSFTTLGFEGSTGTKETPEGA